MKKSYIEVNKNPINDTWSYGSSKMFVCVNCRGIILQSIETLKIDHYPVKFIEMGQNGGYWSKSVIQASFGFTQPLVVRRAGSPQEPRYTFI